MKGGVKAGLRRLLPAIDGTLRDYLRDLEGVWDKTYRRRIKQEQEKYRRLREHLKIDTDDPIARKVGLLDVTGDPDKETLYTKILGWILDPRKPHGFGTEPLKAFCCLAGPEESISHWNLRRASVDTEVTLDSHSVGRPLAGGKRPRPDLIIEIPSRRIAFVIENKINAPVSISQIQKYQKASREKFRRHGYKVRHMLIVKDATGWNVSRTTVLEWKKVGAALASALDRLKRRNRGACQPNLEYLRGYCATIFHDLYEMPVWDTGSEPQPGNLSGVIDYLKLRKETR